MLKKYIIIVNTREYKKMYTIETDDIIAYIINDWYYKYSPNISSEIYEYSDEKYTKLYEKCKYHFDVSALYGIIGKSNK